MKPTPLSIWPLALCILLANLSTYAGAEPPIKIGVSTPLTGNASTYGLDVKNVLQFANQKLANGKYELVFEDDRCNGRDAVTVAHRFIDVLQIKHVLGLPCSGALLPAAPLYERSKVVVISAGSSAESVSKAGEYIFRTWPSDLLAVKILFDYIASKHKTLGVLSEETEYAQGFLQSLNALNVGQSTRIYNQNYLATDRDFRSMLLKLRAEGIDGLLINSQTEISAAAILKDIKTMNWSIPVYNGFLAGSPAFLEVAGDLAENIIFPDFTPITQSYSKDGKELYEEFKLQYGAPKSMDIIFTTAFESFRAMHEAIESGQDERKFLYNTKFSGLVGTWSFDRNGDIQGLSPVLLVIRNQRPVPLS